MSTLHSVSIINYIRYWSQDGDALRLGR